VVSVKTLTLVLVRRCTAPSNLLCRNEFSASGAAPRRAASTRETPERARSARGSSASNGTILAARGELEQATSSAEKRMATGQQGPNSVQTDWDRGADMRGPAVTWVGRRVNVADQHPDGGLSRVVVIDDRAVWRQGPRRVHQLPGR